MEKLGVSNEDLKEELKQELVALLENKNSLTKVGDTYGEPYKIVEERITAVKAKISELEKA